MGKSMRTSTSMNMRMRMSMRMSMSVSTGMHMRMSMSMSMSRVEPGRVEWRGAARGRVAQGGMARSGVE